MSTIATPIPSAEPASRPRTLQPSDVTEEYLRSAAPGQGSIVYEEGYQIKNHQAEINMAVWLHSQFGGDITLLKESKGQGDRTPDYLWNGYSWELKGVTTKNSIDRAIREAAKQILKKSGGILLDISKSELSSAAIEDAIFQRMRRVSLNYADILIISKGCFIKAFRFKR